jgi:uncharacterized protein YqjF (DUF2071 family)
MAPRTILTGTEALTLEIELTFDPRGLTRALPAGLSLDVPDGVARCALLLFRMEDMRVDGLPGPSLRYHEALWRLRVRHDGAPAHFALACDLDHPLVRLVGASLIRYPVRRTHFDVHDGAVPSLDLASTEGRLALTATPLDVVREVRPPLPVFTRAGAALRRIPWREDPPASAIEARLAVSDDALARARLGAVQWPERGVLMRGRTHHCGVAVKA